MVAKLPDSHSSISKYYGLTRVTKILGITSVAGTPVAFFGRMSNQRPTNDGQIYDLATMNYDGIVAKGDEIQVTMVTAPQMLASRDAFKNAGDTFRDSRKTVSDAYKVFKPAMKLLHAWLVTVRAVLGRQLGERWSTAWAAAGFPGPTTEVPTTGAEKISLGVSLKKYYTSHPGDEVPTLDVTADKANELTAAALAAQEGVATAEQTLKNAGTARELARTSVLGAMSNLLANLNRKLPRNDPRWLAFGLQMPSLRTTPFAPLGLRATIMGSDILLECDPTEYAKRYRFRTRIVGVDTKFKLAASKIEPMALLEGVAAGITLEVIAQAVNGGAQSVASEPILVTMPATMAAIAAKPETATTEAELAPLAAISPNGNGNGNGSHAVNRLS